MLIPRLEKCKKKKMKLRFRARAHPGVAIPASRRAATASGPLPGGALSSYIATHHHCLDEGLGRMTCSGGRISDIDVSATAILQIVRRHRRENKSHHHPRDSAALLEEDFEKSVEDSERVQRRRHAIEGDSTKRPTINLAIANGVRTLLLSKNFISTIEGIVAFRNVTKLSLQGNRIRSIHHCAPLQYLPRLEFLSLEYNPVCQLPFYRYHIIAICDRRSITTTNDDDNDAAIGRRGIAHQATPALELLRHLDDRAVSSSERNDVHRMLRKEQAFLLSAIQDYVALLHLDAAKRRLQLHAELFGALIQRGRAIAPAQKRAWDHAYGGGSQSTIPPGLVTFTDSSFHIDLFLKLCVSAIGFALPPFEIAHAIRKEVVAARAVSMMSRGAQDNDALWDGAFATVGSSLHARAISALLELEQTTSPRRDAQPLNGQQSALPVSDDPRSSLFRQCFTNENDRAKVLKQWYCWYEAAATETNSGGDDGATAAKRLHSEIAAQAGSQSKQQQNSSVPFNAVVKYDDPDIDHGVVESVTQLKHELKRAEERESDMQRINIMLRDRLEQYRRANELSFSSRAAAKLPSSISTEGSSMVDAARSEAPIPLPRTNTQLPDVSPDSQATVSHHVTSLMEKESFLNAEIDSLRADNSEKSFALQQLSAEVSDLRDSLQRSAETEERNHSIISQLNGKIFELQRGIEAASHEASHSAAQSQKLQREQYRTLSIQHAFSKKKRDAAAAASAFSSARIRRNALWKWRRATAKRIFLANVGATIDEVRRDAIALRCVNQWKGVAHLVHSRQKHEMAEIRKDLGDCLGHWRWRTLQRRDLRKLIQRRETRCRRSAFEHWKNRSALSQLNQRRDAFLDGQSSVVRERSLKHFVFRRWINRLSHCRSNRMCEEIFSHKVSLCMNRLTVELEEGDAASSCWELVLGLLQQGRPSNNTLLVVQLLTFQRWKNMFRQRRRVLRFRLSMFFPRILKAFRVGQSERAVSERHWRSVAHQVFQRWKNRLLAVLLIDLHHNQDLQLEAALRVEELRNEQEMTKVSADADVNSAVTTTRRARYAAIEAMERRCKESLLRTFFSRWMLANAIVQQSSVNELLADVIHHRTLTVREIFTEATNCLARSNIRAFCHDYFQKWKCFEMLRKRSRAAREESSAHIEQLLVEISNLQQLLNTRSIFTSSSAQTFISHPPNAPTCDASPAADMFFRQRASRGVFHRWMCAHTRSLRAKYAISQSALKERDQRVTDLSTENIKLVHRLHELAARLAQAAAMTEHQEEKIREFEQALRDCRTKEVHEAFVRHRQERMISTLQEQLDHAARDNLSLHTALQVRTAPPDGRASMRSVGNGQRHAGADSPQKWPTVIYPHSLPPPTPPRHEDVVQLEEHYSTPPPHHARKRTEPSKEEAGVASLLRRAATAKERLQAKEEFLLQCQSELERLSKDCTPKQRSFV